MVFDEQETKSVPSTKKGREDHIVSVDGATSWPSTTTTHPTDMAVIHVTEHGYAPSVLVKPEPESQDKSDAKAAERALIEWEQTTLLNVEKEPESFVKMTVEPALMQASKPPSS